MYIFVYLDNCASSTMALSTKPQAVSTYLLKSPLYLHTHHYFKESAGRYSIYTMTIPLIYTSPCKLLHLSITNCISAVEGTYTGCDGFSECSISSQNVCNNILILILVVCYPYVTTAGEYSNHDIPFSPLHLLLLFFLV